MRLMAPTMLVHPRALVEAFFFMFGACCLIWLFFHPDGFPPHVFARCSSFVVSCFDKISKHGRKTTTINGELVTLILDDSKQTGRLSMTESSCLSDGKEEMDTGQNRDASKKPENAYGTTVGINHGKDLLATWELMNFAKEYRALSQNLAKIVSMSDQEVNTVLQKCNGRKLKKMEKALQNIEDPWHPPNVAKLWGYRNLPFPIALEQKTLSIFSLTDEDLAKTFAYVDEIVGEKQARLLLGYIAFNQEPMNISAMAKLFHVGEKRIRKGMAEYIQAGGLVWVDGKRRPGGGRKSITENFRAYMIPECVASGISMEELRTIREVSEANKEFKLLRLNDVQIEKYLPRIRELSANTRELAERCITYASDKGSDDVAEITECAQFLRSVYEAIGDISSKPAATARYERIRFEAGASLFRLLANGVQTMIDTWDDNLPPNTLLFRLEETFWTTKVKTKAEKLVISCHLFEATEVQCKKVENFPDQSSLNEESAPAHNSSFDLLGNSSPQKKLLSLKELSDSTVNTMDTLLQTLMAGKQSATRGEKSAIIEAIHILEKLKDDFVRQTVISMAKEDNEDISISFRFWAQKLQIFLVSLSKGSERTAFFVATQAGICLSGTEFISMNERARDEFQRAVQAAEELHEHKQEANPSTLTTDCRAVPKAPEIDEQYRKDCIDKRKVLDDLAQDLFVKIQAGLECESWGDTTPIKKGQAILNDLYNRYCCTVSKELDNGNARTLRAINYLTNDISLIMHKCLYKWDKASGTPFAKAKAATSILLSANKFPKLVESIWKKYDYDTADPDVGGYSCLAYCDFASVDLEDRTNWFVRHSVPLNPTGRRSIILELYKAGKDPTDIISWLDYIVFSEHCRTITDPSSMKIYSYVRSRHLKNAFFYLTGYKCSRSILWKLLTKEMNVKLRKPKETLSAEDHPLKNLQYRISRARRLCSSPETDIDIYIDTKATIQLGWTKHDDGFLLAYSLDGTCALLDHSFPSIVRTFYPNGTNLVDSSRLDELAVLKPVGAYCPQDKTGYIAYVLGQDTAESMTNMLWCVIQAKKKVNPKLERVTLYADCGGANIANGVAWTNALAKLSKATGLLIECVHFAPGSSKLSKIEHELWSIVSMTCRGRPFKDIETTVGYGNEAGTSTGLTTFCWFDPIKYLTNEEKKQLNMHVMTRDEIDLKLKGRIVHHYTSETDLYKMNYTIFPERQDEEDLALEASLRAISGFEEEAKRIMEAKRQEELAAKAAACENKETDNGKNVEDNIQTSLLQQTETEINK